LGDVVYIDKFDIKDVPNEYAKQKNHPDYQKILQKTKVIGTWDDHDYGMGDGGKNNPYKETYKKLFLDFLDVPPRAAVRQRQGVYQAYDVYFGKKGKKHLVRVILLDVRYFRDILEKATDGINRYKPSLTGSILGAEQWKWFENVIHRSPAQLNLIVSSIQVLSDQHPFEKWANFPREREKLLKILENSHAKGDIILLSGDRHLSEISRLDVSGTRLLEYTSSGMTHVVPKAIAQQEVNPYRVSFQMLDKNFGSIEFTITQPKRTLVLKAIDEQENVVWQYEF
ncbi:MAG: alkaline phosphatase family protein, partial [Flammeovirgaceae bacterium]|nr:alkaline phosphatase family protein [Flammeovirgaceae bacterium]MDW8287770.1 alkaline phosphatase D family protein [Flammeovirgaceae bacterium]